MVRYYTRQRGHHRAASSRPSWPTSICIIPWMCGLMRQSGRIAGVGPTFAGTLMTSCVRSSWRVMQNASMRHYPGDWASSGWRWRLKRPTSSGSISAQNSALPSWGSSSFGARVAGGKLCSSDAPTGRNTGRHWSPCRRGARSTTPCGHRC